MRTLILILAVTLCSPLAAQIEFAFGLNADEIFIDPSGSQVYDAVVSFQCSQPGVEVGGVQLCFTYEPDQINLFGIQSITPANPSFFAPFWANVETTFPGDPTIYGPGVGFVASLFDFSLTNLVVADAPTDLFLFQLYTAPTAIPGGTPIQFVGGGVLDLPGQFDTVLEVAYVNDDGTTASYEVPDFPTVVQLVEHPSFARGDASGDGEVTLVDVIRVLEWGFIFGSPPIPCEATVDFDADGDITAVVSALQILDYLFQGGSPPPDGVGCGARDPMGVSCETSGCPAT